MKYIDLFSGIGGFHLGLRMAGFEFGWVGFSEIDPYAVKVYEKRFPETHSLGDITKIDGTEYEGKIDIITGGFPCQDISTAGKGVGIDGKRSGLWREMHRLVREVRPRVVVVENVPALLAKGLFRVLGDLASCGYDTEWDCVPASALGAPHRRDRIWIVAYPKRTGRDRDVEYRGAPEGRQENKIVRSTHWEHFELVAGEVAPNEWRIEGTTSARPLLVRDNDGVPGRMDRLKCLGNAVVPQVVAWLGGRLKRAMDGGVL